MSLVLNSSLGRYEIRSQLGAGGMGEVYLALDRQLDRTIALKTLPADVVFNGERMRRFVQEAKASAALNHPNIAHIYEIGESDGTHFIAMEYIDGETLGAKIHAEKTPLNKLLNYLSQVAEGLGKAHAAGIVHRDLKPDNVMITHDGYAKILDFGLAKLVEPPAASGARNDSPGETATAIFAQHSTPGMIMGTVGYMSPEQAQGRTGEIDHRSDIFSFGCILYEAATRQKAFAGKDPLDSLHRIVHAPTPQIKDVNVDAPADLQRIVRRCLAKEPDKRYQSIKEVAIELDELRQELRDRDEIAQSLQPESTGEAIGSRDTNAGGSSTQQPLAHTMQTDVTHSTSSAEYLVSGIKSHKKGVVLALIGVTVIIAAGLGLYKYYWSIPTTPAPFQNMRITKLTFNGTARSAVISPDGKQVVYVLEDGGRRSLWLRQVATGTDVKLTEPENVGYFGLTISPDGNFLYYANRGIQNRELYRMPLIGGSARKVVDNTSTPIGFSPDGKQIAFVRTDSSQEGSSLIVANADGTGERQVATRTGGPNRFGNFFFGGVAWSPDGKRIATIARASDSAGRFQNVIEVPVEGGAERVLTSQRWYQIQRVAWLSDGSGLLITAAEKASDAHSRQIWHLSYPGGAARKITNDLSGYGSISLNSDSSILVAVQENMAMDIWVAPNGEASRATQFKSVASNMDGLDCVRWTPDGRIVFNSMAGGRDSIWIMEADGKNRKQLSTAENVDYHPSVTTDGHYVVFVSERTGAPAVWVMNIDGSNQKSLGTAGFNPEAGDGWVVYPNKLSLWKSPIGGGDPVRLSEERLVRCGVSQNGTMIACSLEAPGSRIRLAVLPIDGSSPAKIFDVKFQLPARMRWTPDGRSVTYIGGEGGVADIWSQSIEGGEPKRLTNFKADTIFSYDWSRDNKLVISHGTSTSDVVLITSEK